MHNYYFKVYLCHDSCQENGSIIESAAGWAGKCHIIRSNGSLLRSKITEGVIVEEVAKKWDAVTDMSKATHLNSIQEATMALVSSLEKLRNAEDTQETASEEDSFRFDNKDVILYALGGIQFLF